MDLTNLESLFKGKKFLVFGGVLIFVLIILVVLSAGSRTQPFSLPQPTASLQQLPGSDSSFSLQKNQSVELQKAIAEQTKVDQDYAGWEKSISDNYPWRKKLPLTSEKYYVYFDLNTKVFIGRLYLNSADNVEQIKAEILSQLKEDKGIPVENFKFEWNVFPR